MHPDGCPCYCSKLFRFFIFIFKLTSDFASKSRCVASFSSLSPGIRSLVTTVVSHYSSWCITLSHKLPDRSLIPKSKLSLLLAHSLWYCYLFLPFTESLIFFSFLLLFHWLASPSSAGFCSSSSAHINTLGFLPALLLSPEQSWLFITSSQALTYLSLLPTIPNCYLMILRLKMILTCKGSHFLGNSQVRGARVYWVSHETQVKQQFFPDFSAELQSTPKIFPKVRVIKRQKPFCECSLNWYWRR